LSALEPGASPRSPEASGRSPETSGGGSGIVLSFWMRAPPHRDRTKRRIVITRFAAS
jgi:hypothetical protein